MFVAHEGGCDGWFSNILLAVRLSSGSTSHNIGARWIRGMVSQTILLTSSSSGVSDRWLNHGFSIKPQVEFWVADSLRGISISKLYIACDWTTPGLVSDLLGFPLSQSTEFPPLFFLIELPTWPPSWLLNWNFPIGISARFSVVKDSSLLE